LLDDGLETSAVAERLGVKPDTLSKAVRAGRLHKPAGWPRVIAHPRLPQIRTCPIRASGSSA
jgi:transposase-like protein